jgi:hypothetical protein
MIGLSLLLLLLLSSLVEESSRMLFIVDAGKCRWNVDDDTKATVRSEAALAKTPRDTVRNMTTNTTNSLLLSVLIMERNQVWRIIYVVAARIMRLSMASCVIFYAVVRVPFA